MVKTGKAIQVGISAEFLKSYSRISKQKQAKVREFIEKFKSDPTSSGLNYERINGAKDANLRSVRVDQQYRAIVLSPKEGNVFMLLYVDKHDDAYNWSRERQFKIHPDTGALQVIDVSQAESTPDSEAQATTTGLFERFRDRELERLGVPRDLLPVIRRLKSEEDLEASIQSFPEEAFEALYMLAAGFSQDEVYKELVAIDTDSKVDTTDFSSALKRPNSQRRFTLIEDDLELRQMLAAPLELWRVFLHPSQRRVVEMRANGPVRVLGGAGTGKTVVAMHRAKWLAEHFCPNKDDRILLTTFTRNLATDIQANLQQLCSITSLKHIEVINIDAWIARFLRQNGYEHEIVYDQQVRSLWENALNLADESLGLSPQFYKDEWEQVIQHHGITDLESYLRINRLGRGRRLSRRERPKVWTVFEEYRSQLSDRRFKEPADAARDAHHLLEQREAILPYRGIVLDEAQDMSAEVFRLLRQMIPANDQGLPNDLFITGDAHQRIYRHRVVLSHCGINIVGRGRLLRINYRTTEETRNWALRLLKGQAIDDLDIGTDDRRGYKSLLHGPEPQLIVNESFVAEIDTIDEHLKNLKTQGVAINSICLVTRTNDLLAQFEGALCSRGYESYRIRRSTPDDRKAHGLRFATMHRVKGLEFEHVIVAGANDGIVPLSQAIEAENPTDRSQNELRERSLLYVAITRARQSVLITTSASPSRFLTVM